MTLLRSISVLCLMASHAIALDLTFPWSEPRIARRTTREGAQPATAITPAVTLYAREGCPVAARWMRTEAPRFRRAGWRIIRRTVFPERVFRRAQRANGMMPLYFETVDRRGNIGFAGWSTLERITNSKAKDGQYETEPIQMQQMMPAIINHSTQGDGQFWDTSTVARYEQTVNAPLRPDFVRLFGGRRRNNCGAMA